MASTKLPTPALLPTIEPPRHSSVQLRFTNRPTVAIQQFDAPRLQEVIMGIFKRFGYSALDLESLIFFVLQYFHVTPETYEHMHERVRSHIVAHFAISQGKLLRLTNVSMRRLFVCYTIDKAEDV